MRAIRLTLLVPLVAAAAVVLGTVAEADEFRVKGVLISPSGSSALVNNKILREGEQLDGVEILEIREGEVLVRRGSQQLTVWVGSRAVWDLARPYKPFTPEVPPPAMAADSYGPVQRGETLSEIAERHLVGDQTINQMMVALYETNPDAFDGNINRLREGAVLQMPDRDVLHGQAVASATEEVLRQTKAWRDELAAWLKPAMPASPETYGPVKRGQTLSGIASSLAREGTTMNQMMIALFEANPQAFDGNINLLQVGAVLQVPDETALRRYTHASATATVVDHMEAWRHDDVQQLQSNNTTDDVMHVDDRILLSMRGIR